MLMKKYVGVWRLKSWWLRVMRRLLLTRINRQKTRKKVKNRGLILG